MSEKKRDIWYFSLANRFFIRTAMRIVVCTIYRDEIHQRICLLQSNLDKRVPLLLLLCFFFLFNQFAIFFHSLLSIFTLLFEYTYVPFFILFFLSEVFHSSDTLRILIFSETRFLSIFVYFFTRRDFFIADFTWLLFPSAGTTKFFFFFFTPKIKYSANFLKRTNFFP